MSSRQLRKLRQQKELENAHKDVEQDSDGSEGSEELVQIASKPRPSLFAALGGDDNDVEDDDDDDEDVEIDEEDSKPQPLDTASNNASEVIPTNTSKKNKKKKKKGKKPKASSTGLHTPQNDVQDDGEDEIDKAIKELQLNTSKKNQDGEATVENDESSKLQLRLNELLSINPYHLRAINEMRNLFGREVMESANAEEQQEQQNRRRRQPMQQQVDLETFLREPPGAKKLPEVSLRRNIFVQGRDHWPRQSAGGLTMVEVETSPDGLWTEYAYVHDKDYDAMQAFFFACVQIGDPMRMVHLLKRAPYHVSTLLQVSSVAKQDQNMALSAELLERALFTFGRVTTSAFRQNIEHGRARLDFRRPENRQFWLAGYHYLKSLVRKGTYRTALEWAKLLYALDPKDPYAMRYYIQFLALRAHESRWLIDFLDCLAKAGGHSDIVYIQQSLVLANLQAGNTQAARDALTQGVQTVPWLYCALFQELNLDAPQSIWGISSDSDDKSFWVKLYIYLTKDLWNNAQATTLLQDVTKSLTRVDVSALPKVDSRVDLGATRLAYLEGQTSLLAVAPRALLDSQPNYEFDPLPPAEEDNIFTVQGTQLPWRDRQVQDQGRANDLLAQMQNMLARRGVPGAEAGAAMGMGMGMNGGEEDDEDDEEIRALRRADDEELQRDIEAHMNWGDEPGIMATLMQMIGISGGPRNDEGGGGGDEEGLEEEEREDSETPPGAWPGAQDGR